ncbi:very short patch repair endonuclease [Photobacterium sp. SDRW27]|uniref:very short patch repair endonuclease n=1 Tax=Photobacterium obscurum TaxID=2829490 RepID=UPI002244B2EE|nr:very short patch repair endonuclease [Photobacterium obscurum]MCW8332041.1 very short patch repair endonuclease [Photobacterium obscurum]
MTDVHNSKTRSKNMRAIKSKDTKPEIQLRRALHKRGFRYRVAPKEMPGKPDLWLPRWNAAIFVHGCFWHVHECQLFRWPDTREEFWRKKLLSNRARDKAQLSELKKKNIRVLIVWECSLKGKNKLGPEMVAMLAETWLRSGSASAELDPEGLKIK